MNAARRPVAFALIAACLGLLTLPLTAQQSASMGPDARRFVAIDAPVVALTNVRVIDGTGAPARERQTVVLTDGRISAIGAGVAIPAGARVLDLAGHTVTPGLVMLHEHLFYPVGRMQPGLLSYVAQNSTFPKLYLAFGATTIRTAGTTSPYSDISVKHDIDSGLQAGPHIVLTGPFIDRPGYPIPYFKHIDSPEAARRVVRYWADVGMSWFKAYTFVTRADLEAIIDEAHRLGRKVTAHLCSVTHGEAAALGIDELEHGLLTNTEFLPNKEPDRCPGEGLIYQAAATLDLESPAVRRAMRNLVERKIPMTSTLPIWETMVPGRIVQPGALEALSPELREDYLTIQRRIASDETSTFAAAFANALRWEREFVRAGGLLGAGSDPTGYGGTIAGYGNIRELELLVEAGFTPIEAITIASRNGARILGMEERIGTLEVGKQADLVVVRGNPVERIADMENPVYVFKQGIGYDSAKLIAAVKGLVGRF
ncbi:MAG: amidohydrolase family protein [Gemmatimonadales bacterium]